MSYQRNPYERIRRAYAYTSLNPTPGRRLNDAAKFSAENSFEDFFFSEAGRSDRHMLLYMFGIRPDTDLATTSLEQLYESAVENLSDYIVGTTDRFDDFTNYLARELAIVTPLTRRLRFRKRQTPGKFRNFETVSPVVERAMREMLHWDFKFYEAAKAMSLRLQASTATARHP